MCLRVPLQAGVEVRQLQLEERFHRAAGGDVVDGGGELGVVQLLRDGLEGVLEGGGGGDVCGDADSVAAGRVDFGDEVFIAFLGAGEENHWVGLGKAFGNLRSS